MCREENKRKGSKKEREGDSDNFAFNIFRAADINEDGTIDFEEFKNMLGVDIE